MKHVLVTGANGFVGHHLVKELSDNGIVITAVGGPRLAENTDSRITTYLSLDLTSREAANSINFSDIDAVIHLAGLAAVGPSFDAPMDYITTNIGIQTNLFEAALAQGAKPRFLVISSGSLYDPKAELPLTETSVVAPSSPYAVSKLGQEQMAKYYLGRGFEIIIARPFNHIGPGQGLGFLVPDLTKQIVDSQGDGGKILVGNLDAQRDYTDVRDIVRAYRLLIQSGKSGETYNVCSGTPLSGHQILETLLSASGKQLTVEQDPAKMRPADNPIIYGDHSKLTTDTGWQPSINIATTLSDVLADWQQQPK